MFCVAPKEKGATPDEIPNPGQSKAMVTMTMPVLVRLVIVMLLLPEAFPIYVLANERDAGFDEMSVVCEKADAAVRVRIEQMPNSTIRQVNDCIKIQPPLSQHHGLSSNTTRTCALGAKAYRRRGRAVGGQS